MIRYKKPTVQLTSLLDLLFLMIFISLIQAKDIPDPTVERSKFKEAAPIEEKKTPKKVVTKAKTKPKPSAQKKVISVTAIFAFYPVATNPEISKGSYEMRGEFNRETGALQLGGSSWIKQPPNYDMVPLKGIINAERTEFIGKIQFYGCKQFKLHRTGPGQGIQGTWDGTYTCLQGDTGLTLTIR